MAIACCVSFLSKLLQLHVTVSQKVHDSLKRKKRKIYLNVQEVNALVLSFLYEFRCFE